MNKDDEKMMDQYGITFERKLLYSFFYKGFKYEKLGDAVKYAKIQTAREK